MERIPDLDWPQNLYLGDIADQLMIEHQENGFWEEGDCFAYLGNLGSGVPVICSRSTVVD